MSLPYEKATSGERALEDIRKVLTSFGCATFGSMTDTEKREVIVQFVYRGRQVSVKATWGGYAKAWMKEHPHDRRYHRHSLIDHERRAMDQAQIAVNSILRDWIKGQVTAIECGILSFEGAFLGQIFLPQHGMTVLDLASAQKLLPAPSGDA